jgi:hypothetical protein
VLYPLHKTAYCSKGRSLVCILVCIGKPVSESAVWGWAAWLQLFQHPRASRGRNYWVCCLQEVLPCRVHGMWSTIWLCFGVLNGSRCAAAAAAACCACSVEGLGCGHVTSHEQDYQQPAGTLAEAQQLSAGCNSLTDAWVCFSTVCVLLQAIAATWDLLCDAAHRCVWCCMRYSVLCASLSTNGSACCTVRCCCM